ncbi:MAG TPA: NAD(P)/FAD-dependent oxidoreductase [Pyrinomonadaceae bacterium]|nr:NAD(P)/FAD-dependent oxidoreductase [Pyrinomonadaceae bacterium]
MTRYNGIKYVPDRTVKRRSWARVIVIGGGQAGLAIGHFLKKAGVDFLILESGHRIGDSWRKRWDSLRLFSSVLHDGLPGIPFPGDPRSFPTKDEVANYLEDYALKQELPIRFNTRVKSLHRQGDGFVVMTNGREYFEAEQVVVATGPYQKLRVPSWAAELDPAIVQIHAGQYKNPAQLPEGDVLVVGAGNTGAELAMEAAAGHKVWLSGRDVGQVPSFARFGNQRLFWFLGRRVFTLKTPVGRMIHASVRSGHGQPLVRIRRKELLKAGIRRVGRTVGASSNGKPRLADGRVLDVTSILWCTGFRLDFSWIHLPILADDGYPLHEFGRVKSQPGLYFLALPFQRDMTSTLLGGVGRDAALVAKWILERRAMSSRGRRIETDEAQSVRETRMTGT